MKKNKRHLGIFLFLPFSVPSLGPYIKDVRNICGIFDPLPPTHLVMTHATSLTLPYYVCFRASPFPPPGADVLYDGPFR